jgi:radical S-adenosyl methionine domain-containing protein 2
MKNNQPIIPSVNFHLWEPCNMRCKFCFAGFKDVKYSILPKGHLPKEDALKLVREFGQFGFEKITFAGGEPTLCPWLPELVAQSKSVGLTTMLVTNGSRLSPEYLRKYSGTLDWVVLSIDSCSPETNQKSGRHLSGNGYGSDEYTKLALLIKNEGLKLKVNTVVHRLNMNENMIEIISKIKPERWKILKVLSVQDQNGFHYPKFEISDEEFQNFMIRNSITNDSTKEIVENNNDMRGSYLMVDPAGRFFDNVNGMHRYSRTILSDGIIHALTDVEYNFDKFISRGGRYNW